MTTEQAEVGRKLSAIWFIPLLAAALGVYMVIHTWMTEGPEVTIDFKTASGLVAGKTKIKYRNVDMGLVEEVRLSDDLEGVVAKVKLDRQALPLLREDTRFWVVTARVGMGNISGLDTLLSGAYIQLAPGNGAEGRRQYSALEQPPLTPTDAAGLRLKLTSGRATSIDAGDAVLYKGYQVGRVESREFDTDERKVNYVIYIDAPYHELVNSAVRFWDISGIDVSAGADGIKVRTGSLATILAGGVAFGMPRGVLAGPAVEHNTSFRLYANHEAIMKNPFIHGVDYVLSFDESIKGLLPGAPVEFRGIPVGKVERVLLQESIQHSIEVGQGGGGDPIPVLIYLEPGRLEMPDTAESVANLAESIRSGVTNGMRASMETGNLLTGAKFISIDFFEGVEPAQLGRFLTYDTIPTISTGLGQIEQKVTALLDKVNALPLEATVDRGNTALATLNESLASLNEILESKGVKELPAELDATLAEIRRAVGGLSPESELYQSLSSSLSRLNRSLGNLDSLTRTLANQPNAVILPSGPEPDPVPEVRQ